MVSLGHSVHHPGTASLGRHGCSSFPGLQDARLIHLASKHMASFLENTSGCRQLSASPNHSLLNGLVLGFGMTQGVPCPPARPGSGLAASALGDRALPQTFLGYLCPATGTAHGGVSWAVTPRVQGWESPQSTHSPSRHSHPGHGLLSSTLTGFLRALLWPQVPRELGLEHVWV